MYATSTPRGLPFYAASREDYYFQLLHEGATPAEAAAVIEREYRDKVVNGEIEDVAIAAHFKNGGVLEQVDANAFPLTRLNELEPPGLFDLLRAIGGGFYYKIRYSLDKSPRRSSSIRPPYPVSPKLINSAA